MSDFFRIFVSVIERHMRYESDIDLKDIVYLITDCELSKDKDLLKTLGGR